MTDSLSQKRVAADTTSMATAAWSNWGGDDRLSRAVNRSSPGLSAVPSNNSMQRTALRAAADTGR